MISSKGPNRQTVRFSWLRFTAFIDTKEQSYLPCTVLPLLPVMFPKRIQDLFKYYLWKMGWHFQKHLFSAYSFCWIHTFCWILYLHSTECKLFFESKLWLPRRGCYFYILICQFFFLIIDRDGGPIENEF